MNKLNDYSLLEEIEKANKKEDLLKILGIILGGTVVVTLGQTITSKDLQEVENQKEYIMNAMKNGLGISTIIAGLEILRQRAIAYLAKLKLEEVVDALEENQKVYISVETLKEAKVKPNEKLTEEGTKVTDIILEDVKGQPVELREYDYDLITGEFSDVYYVESEDKEHILILK